MSTTVVVVMRKMGAGIGSGSVSAISVDGDGSGIRGGDGLANGGGDASGDISGMVAAASRSAAPRGRRECRRLRPLVGSRRYRLGWAECAVGVLGRRQMYRRPSQEVVRRQRRMDHHGEEVVHADGGAAVRACCRIAARPEGVQRAARARSKSTISSVSSRTRTGDRAGGRHAATTTAPLRLLGRRATRAAYYSARPMSNMIACSFCGGDGVRRARPSKRALHEHRTAGGVSAG